MHRFVFISGIFLKKIELIGIQTARPFDRLRFFIGLQLFGYFSLHQSVEGGEDSMSIIVMVHMKLNATWGRRQNNNSTCQTSHELAL